MASLLKKHLGSVGRLPCKYFSPFVGHIYLYTWRRSILLSNFCGYTLVSLDQLPCQAGTHLGRSVTSKAKCGEGQVLNGMLSGKEIC